MIIICKVFSLLVAVQTTGHRQLNSEKNIIVCSELCMFYLFILIIFFLHSLLDLSRCTDCIYVLTLMNYFICKSIVCLFERTKNVLNSFYFHSHSLLWLFPIILSPCKLWTLTYCHVNELQQSFCEFYSNLQLKWYEFMW